MAIESIGNIMSTQATSYVSVKSLQSENNIENSSTDIGYISNEKIDNNTRVVENTEMNGDAANDESREGGYPSNEQLKQAVERINKNSLYNSEAVFGIHEGTNRVTIKLVDKDSKKVIKELPPEKTLDMIARVWEMAGILIDEKR